MEFRIASTFVDSLARLNNQEQKAVKTTVMDLQLDPSRPGLSFHRLDRAQDPDFASVRASRDLRVIVHRRGQSLLICYAGHHDDAYAWAGRRKLETHPRTGAAQLVEVRETVTEIVIPAYVPAEQHKPRLFAGYSDDELLGYGVPPEWLADVRAAHEDSILAIASHLPTEAAEALLELAVGSRPEGVPPAPVAADPFAHPDALRRFRVVSDVAELERALEFPWEKWVVFLHPDQEQTVRAAYSGPARVSGSAGTGKTVVALHRAAHLASKNPGARLLLATFSDTLAHTLQIKLRRLVHDRPALAETIEVYAMNAIGERLYGLNIGAARLAAPHEIRALVQQAAANVPGHGFSLNFLLAEWGQVVDAWQLETWEAYRDVLRLGRKTRLPESRRQVLWNIFARVRVELGEQGWISHAGMFNALAEYYRAGHPIPFEYMVIDEAQDISVPQLRFLAALGANRPESLFFAGDLGQRIFQQPFSWKALGVDVRGRSRTLRVNYRTSHQIRRQADRLLGPELSDVDGNTETRGGTISVFNGAEPVIERFETEQEESEGVGRWLAEWSAAGIAPQEIGVFVRSAQQIGRAQAAIQAAGLPCRLLDEKVEAAAGRVSLCSMHLAKGLEFRTVAVMACDDEVIPLQARIEESAEESDLEDVYNTERHLLYVACTRARDQLLVTCVQPGSEFLDDMEM